MSLKNQLNRFKSHLTVEKNTSHVSQSVPSAASEVHAKPHHNLDASMDPMNGSQDTEERQRASRMDDIPFLEKWQQLQAHPWFDLDMHVMVRESRYPISYLHGHYPLSDLKRVVDAWNQTNHQHPLSTSGRRVEDLLFFDTETTGLQGGAGNTIFLLGLSQMIGDAVIVKQFFLPGPEHEVAMYRAFIGEIKASTHLVTYNGKSFDWPQVKTRHTLVRDEVPPLPVFSHFDLLHGARRLWKNRLESCRLSIVEPDVLGVQRGEDTPGFMAPYLYFEYLHDRNPAGMEGILRHNECDVLSLITLYIHISDLLLDPSITVCSGEERLEIARWYEAVGEIDRAIEYLLLVMERDPMQKAQAMLTLAALYKKQKRWQEAISLWESFIKQQTYVPTAVYTELSKVYEHHLRDFDRALYYADFALDAWQNKHHILKDGSDRDERQQLKQRIERLEKKIHI